MGATSSSIGGGAPIDTIFDTLGHNIRESHEIILRASGNPPFNSPHEKVLLYLNSDTTNYIFELIDLLKKKRNDPIMHLMNDIPRDVFARGGELRCYSGIIAAAIK